MSIDQAQIELRPLGAYSCTDLGFTLARHCYWSLVRLYLLLSISVFAVVGAFTYVYPEYSVAAYVAFWWLKPFGELALLYWCSQSLFGASPKLGTSLFSAYKSLPRLLLNYLGVFRLSPTRGLSMCVVFLEKPPIGQGRRRLDVLSGSGASLTWVWVVGAHVELILAVGIYAMLVYLVPFDTALTESFEDGGAVAWLERVNSNIFILCAFSAQVIFAPFFVCASFVHYINRRSRLEAWDIQHKFNSLKNRVAQEKKISVSKSSSSVAVFLFACSLIFSVQTEHAYAASAADNAEVVIADILQQDQFGHYIDRSRLRLKEQDDESKDTDESEDTDESADSFVSSILEYTYRLVSRETFSTAVYWLVAALVGYGFLRVLIGYWPVISGFATSLTMPRRARKIKPSSESRVLPASFVETRQLMLSGDTRAALACLLRAVIETQKPHDGQGIKRSCTETECQQQIEANSGVDQKVSFTALLKLWRQQAYAGRDVPALYADRVISECENAFSEKRS